MAKELRFPVLILLSALLLLRLRLPLEQLFQNFSTDALLNFFWSAVVIRSLILICLVSIIFRFHLLAFNGFATPVPARELQLLVLPLFFISLIALSNMETFRLQSCQVLLLYALNAVLTGAMEELAIRGIMLPLFLLHFSSKNKPFLKAVLLSSILFGIAHYTNLFAVPDDPYGVTSQVIYATGIGIYLSALLFRTGNILIPITIHACINFSGGPFI